MGKHVGAIVAVMSPGHAQLSTGSENDPLKDLLPGMESHGQPVYLGISQA